MGGFAQAIFDGGTAFVHDVESFAGFVLDAANGSGDFLGSDLGAFGEAADFTGDDGEATTVFTGACGFDGCVEGEEVGLLADFLDDVDDFADFFRTKGKGGHFVGDGGGG